MQKVTPETLRAWADGELSPEQTDEIDALLAVDEELAAQAACFEASKLPYKAAMNVDIPPVPTELRMQVEHWSRLSEVYGNTDEDDGEPPVQKRVVKRRVYRVALAAAVVLMMISGLGAMFYKPATDPVEEWAQAIVTYQNFYVAETVEPIEADPQAATQKLAQLRLDYPAFPAAPPNLEKLGYQFKRVQRLDFDNKPVVQMVFFKAGKRPLAICLMPDESTLTAKFTQHELLNSYVWQSGKLRAIVVAEEDAAQLGVISSLLVAG